MQFPKKQGIAAHNNKVFTNNSRRSKYPRMKNSIIQVVFMCVEKPLRPDREKRAQSRGRKAEMGALNRSKIKERAHACCTFSAMPFIDAEMDFPKRGKLPN